MLSDDEAHTMRDAIREALAHIQPVRVPIASDLLALNEKTARSWVCAGVVIEADTTSSRKHLDPKRLHEVLHLVRESRQAKHGVCSTPCGSDCRMRPSSTARISPRVWIKCAVARSRRPST